MEKRRRIVLGVGLAALAVLASHPPSANVEVITHDVRDTAPHRVKAAIDLGVVAVSVLYTWSAGNFAR